MLEKSAAPSFSLLRKFMALPLITAAVMMLSFNMVSSTAGSITPAKKKIILAVDPGHGGDDAGAKSGAFLEKDICLLYAKRLQELASGYNIEVQLTRNNDESVPLSNRVALCDKVKADLFLSLHVENEQGTNKAKGDFDIFISGKAPFAERSGNCSNSIFTAMVNSGIIPGETAGCMHNPSKVCSQCIGLPASNVAVSKKEGVFVLNNAHVPAMVMVLGNIKNTQAMQNLVDHNKMDLLCNTILKGIVEGAEAKTIPKTGCGPVPQSNDKYVFARLTPNMNN